MSMSRKDFQALAEAMADTHPTVLRHRAQVESPGGIAEASQQVQWRICFDAVAGVCRHANPSFDPERFERVTLDLVRRYSTPGGLA